MLVKSHDRHDVVAEFDPATGVLQPQPRPPGLPLHATDGWFADLAGVTVVFYRETGRLWLRAGERVFDLDGDASVEWHTSAGTAEFRVHDPSDEVVLRYAAGPNLDRDPTPFVSDEDWDLGLFVVNVTSDEGRRTMVRNGAR